MSLARIAMPASLALLLAACAAEPPVIRDGPSTRKLTPADVQDAVPKPEPRSRYGNRSPYEVLGKKYTVLASSKDYRKKGIASWYGSKFHGRNTSSGEVFDMHKATAAHRNLPLPTYAKVTNLENGREVIVKINDRGPFHSDRIIDLSYGAAVRLGMVATGTARVEVRAIAFDEPEPATPAARIADGTFLQVGAFSGRDAAEALAGRMMHEHLQPVSIQLESGLYKVWIGPYRWEKDIQFAQRRVVELGLEHPHKVRR